MGLDLNDADCDQFVVAEKVDGPSLGDVMR